jgi:hypothetical protein
MNPLQDTKQEPWDDPGGKGHADQAFVAGSNTPGIGFMNVHFSRKIFE